MAKYPGTNKNIRSKRKKSRQGAAPKSSLRNRILNTKLNSISNRNKKTIKKNNDTAINRPMGVNRKQPIINERKYKPVPSDKDRAPTTKIERDQYQQWLTDQENFNSRGCSCNRVVWWSQAKECMGGNCASPGSTCHFAMPCAHKPNKDRRNAPEI